MRFCQIDRITEFTCGEQLQALRGLALNEEYLQDHFPRFPVMPGVLMLESIFQASMWLVLATERFQYSTVILKKANHVKFNDFVEPGRQLEVTVNWKSQEGDEISITASGQINGKPALKARLVVERFNLSDRGLAPVETDNYLKSARRSELLRLLDPRGKLRQEILDEFAELHDVR